MSRRRNILENKENTLSFCTWIFQEINKYITGIMLLCYIEKIKNKLLSVNVES